MSRKEQLKQLLKQAENSFARPTECENCGYNNPPDTKNCLNCEITNDKSSLDYTKARVWAELESLSHYLKYEFSKDKDSPEKILEDVDDCISMVKAIRELLFFSDNAPFKYNS